MTHNFNNLASYLDHTYLHADATQSDLQRICQEAIDFGFYSVCVNSANVPLVAKILEGTNVKVVSTVGFPLGASRSDLKVFEAREAEKLGAHEVDMVINVGALKDGNEGLVLRDMAQVVSSVSIPVKVIIETALLNDEEKILACELAKKAGAAFVKTSTGFSSSGATIHDVRLMKKVVGPDMQVKASGGIRTREDAIEMIEAGATRLGTSASVNIVKGTQSEKGGY